MKIAVVGSGSIGLYYGGKLAAAGQDMHFLVRSGWDHARRDGLHVDSPETGSLHLTSPQLHQSTEEIGPVDLVIVAVKATANSALAELLPPLVTPNTTFLTLQNGLGGDELLAEWFGPDRVMGGLCFICLTRDEPHRVRHVGRGMLTVGEFLGPPRERTREIVAAWESTGVAARVIDNLAGERWRKLVWNIPFNGLGVAAGGVSVDRILADPELLSECRELMRETIAAANALGHPIDEGFADRQIERTRPMGAYFPSTVIDFQTAQPLEVEAIWGEPLRRAQSAGVETPYLARLHERLVALDPTPDSAKIFS